jgi:hypothetical protein
MRIWYILRKPCTYHAPTLTPSPNWAKRDLAWPKSPRSSIRCVRNNSYAYGMFGANHALSYTDTNVVSKQTETSFHLSLVTLKYHQVRPKRFLCLWYIWRKLCTYLTLTLTPSPNGPKRDWAWPTSSKTIPIPMVRLAQTMHLSYTVTNNVSKQTEMRLNTTHVT